MRDKQYAQNGNVIVLTAILFPLLIAFVALAVDVAGFSGQHSRQTDITQIAKEAQSDAAIVMKYSDVPGGDIARYMVDIVRANDFKGQIKVCFYELSAKEIPVAQTVSNRYYAYKVTLLDNYHSNFAHIFGISEIEISTDLLGLGHPYSNAAVWRPTYSDNGIFTSESAADGSNLKFSAITNIADLPLDMQKNLNQLKDRDQ